MITGILWLAACQLVGEVLARAAGLPIPGPVVGMVLMLGVLEVRGRRRPAGGEPDPIGVVADALLRHLQLLFVPAGVGVVTYLGLIGSSAVPVSVALVGSWCAGLATVAGLTVGLGRLTDRADAGRGEAR